MLPRVRLLGDRLIHRRRERSCNLVRSEERRARRWRLLSVLLPVAPEAFEPAAPAALLARERERHLARALAELPLAHRVPLVLAEIEGWSHRDIAAHLGCREGIASPEWQERVKSLTVTGEGLGARLEEMERELQRLERHLEEQNRQIEEQNRELEKLR